MKICIDDGSTNIKLAWTENGPDDRHAIPVQRCECHCHSSRAGQIRHHATGGGCGCHPATERVFRHKRTAGHDQHQPQKSERYAPGGVPERRSIHYP
ncbi:TPA: hypothetical protein HJJ23_005159 [Escherichia coli]|nr:hypothetical protein [Escherichia coli]HAI7424676.1 hypothetical protein [Escherichia coli]